jgi:hypothetical protein
MPETDDATHRPSPTFEPRVEAEEGDPTRGDFIIGAAVAVAVIVGILWAIGVINWPR